MCEAAIGALLAKRRYDVSILPELEAHIDSAAYDLEVGLAALKLYQFHPDALKVPTVAKVLIKALMRAMALTNFSPGMGNVPAAGLDDGKLCLALNDIFGSTRLFGSGVFSLAANLLCDVMNHEPTSYWKLEKHGTPEAFIAAWEKPKEHAPLPSADALACLPVTLGALSLSAEGLERVKKSKALDALVDAFTTRTYAKLLQGETASTIGGNLDELLRHVPSLQDMGVDLAVDVLRRLVELGGGVVET